MKIPDVPNVPIDLDDSTIEFLETLDDILGNGQIAVVNVDEEAVYVLGYDGRTKYGGCTISHMITKDMRTGEISDIAFTNFRIDLSGKFDKKREQYRNANLKDAAEKVEDIKVYQGSIEEVAKRVGKPLEAVDTHQPETFIVAENSFMLRVRAYQLGGEAIAHYQNESFSERCTGTPVRYADTKSNLKAA